MRRHLAASLAFAATSVAQTSDAAVQLTGQTRSVHTESTGNAGLWVEPTTWLPPTLSFQQTDSDDASASDFGLFDAAVASAAPDVLIFPLTGSGAATQTSSLSTDAITASASTDTSTDSYWLIGPPLDLVNQQLAPPTYIVGVENDTSVADVHFSVQFDVSAPTPYTLTGSLGTSAVGINYTLFGTGWSQATGSIELRNALGESVAEVAIDQYEFCTPLGGGEVICVPGSRPLSAQGVLAPGSYVLEARASNSAAALCAALHVLFCFDVSNSADFEVELTFESPPAVPGPAPVWLGALALALAATGLRSLRRFHA